MASSGNTQVAQFKIFKVSLCLPSGLCPKKPYSCTVESLSQMAAQLDFGERGPCSFGQPPDGCSCFRFFEWPPRSKFLQNCWLSIFFKQEKWVVVVEVSVLPVAADAATSPLRRYTAGSRGKKWSSPCTLSCAMDSMAAAAWI